MHIGSGWTKTNKEGNTFISITIDESLRELFPQLNNLRFILSYVSERTSDKAPHWKLSTFVSSKDDGSNKTTEANQEIIKEALPFDDSFSPEE